MQHNFTTPSNTLSPTASAVEDEPLAARRRRLRFRANHRGTFETDILIGGFVEETVDSLNAEELADMESILEMPDPDLTDWLFGRLPLPEEKATPMLRRMVETCRARCGK
ncbi:succinate dehydrogenase assembly factor 2 [Acetobacter fabarum]|uniref:FAD assembly factor SdhE n=1 Tax=Acetobacter fabarum TaxID=483199 RepID=UPI00312B40D8